MTSHRLPPLVALKAFEAVGRFESIRKAASALSVDHTVVVRHLFNLEEWLGTRLVERTGRGIHLTPGGKRYLALIEPAFQQIAAATAELKPPTHSGEFRIWCVAGLATRWLAPRLGALRTILSNFEIVLRPTREKADLVRQQAHAEIRYGRRGEKNVEEHELAFPSMFPVASPEFIRQQKRPLSLQSLAQLPLLHENSPEQWRNWLIKASVDLSSLPPIHGPRLWHADLAIDSAIAGEGVALANEYIAGPNLKNGELMEVLSTRIKLEPYVLHVHRDHRNEPAVRKLRSWLSAELG